LFGAGFAQMLAPDPSQSDKDVDVSYCTSSQMFGKTQIFDDQQRKNISEDKQSSKWVVLSKVNFPIIVFF